VLEMIMENPELPSEFPPRWSVLRPYGNSAAVRLSVLVPVIGYLLILNTYVVDYISKLDPRFSMISEDYPYRLLVFYIATIFLATASLLYSRFCPALVRKYPSPVEFINSDIEFFWATGHYDFTEAQVRSEYVSLADDDRARNEFGRIDALLQPTGGDTEERRGRLIELLTIKYHVRDIQKPILRGVCFALYIIGFILLAIPTLWTFLEVVLSFLRYHHF
jgi:hypothetical protein